MKDVKPIPRVTAQSVQDHIPHKPRIQLRMEYEILSPILDLHGMTLQQAHAAVMQHVAACVTMFPYVTIITGKSGIMHEQLPDWVNTIAQIRSCEPINGGGAFRLCFKKPRPKHK
jgi:DNA-nicking Smr family endonuclease